jgi:uncharacterized protein (DUF433 family)
MQIAEQSYIQEREGNFCVGDTRVTVRSVIAEWLQGLSPEEIARDFPGLALAQVYGTIASYLEREAEFDALFRKSDVRAAHYHAEAEASDLTFYAMMRQRFAQARAQRSQQTHQEWEDREVYLPL